MREAGVRIALSSDCPVERLDAFQAIASAVGRHEWSFCPEEKLTPMEAIEAYCLGSAYAGFLEESVGSLEAGKWGDFVVLSGDPSLMAAEQIRELKAEAVFIAGKQVRGSMAEAAHLASRTG